MKWMVPLVLALCFGGCLAEQDSSGQGAGYSGDDGFSQTAQLAPNVSKSYSGGCDGSGTWSISGQMGSGSSLRLTDGSGSEVWSRSGGFGGQFSVSQGVSGASGTWTLSVQSGSGLQFAANLDC